ncbi:hypothetical protein [Aeromicrobium ginsengisoli]|uniref:Glycerophosphoryl diester phosphodiesterase membrane domain-containing protein n=1 Tax=Aeromicrobium ginsengisoli TaxID=363867 RepID=A0A5M4FGG5_9ACTN|nr:hypothetical protein [Aeromicrobium ginsengisoli]KAA1398226.1 hypothetical protein ESP70_012945 [Aeromicrobium ginsengisoli]
MTEPPEGQPPYYPPPPGYYTPPPRQPYEIGEMLSWSWRKFTEHWKVFVLGMVPMILLMIAFYVAYFVFYLDLMLNGEDMSDAEIRRVFIRIGIAIGVFFVLLIPVSLLQTNLQRVALAIADGTTPTFAMLYDTRGFGRLLVTFLTLGAATLVGMVLCFLPGLAFGFFASFTILFVLDQDMRTVEAIKASFRLVREHLGLALLSVLLIGVISGLGSYAIVVGLAVSIPVSLLMQVYCFRALTRGTISQ